MSRRYLFGPISRRFLDRNLGEHWATIDCVPFDAAGQLPFCITDGDSWETVLQRLPSNWRPDFLVLDLHYTSIPGCLWNSPVPIIGLAADWNLLWHGYRRLLPHVDLILTDTTGVEVLAKEGIHHALAANLFGLEAGWLAEQIPATGPRPIDVLFVGNLHPAVQRERLTWLGRLGALSDRYRISIHQGLYDDQYRDLVRQSKIVFNRSIRGECNMRVFEAAAGGALLFQEEGNREVEAYFQDRKECVLYNEHNLEELLAYYLEHEDERLAIVEAALSKVGEFTFAKLWSQHLTQIDQMWPTIEERARQRVAANRAVDLTGRVWQALGSTRPQTDANLVQDLNAAVRADPGSADLHNSLGMALVVTNAGNELQPIGEAFLAAARRDGSHLIANLNLAETLSKAGQQQAVITEAKTTLRAVEHYAEEFAKSWAIPPDEAPAWLDAPKFPHGFDFFRVEWERAAWGHAGDRLGECRAKLDLIRWRLHYLLAELTGDLAHYFEAVLARPDLPTSRAGLGCALARAGQPELAIPHLRFAVEQNPFDLPAARALFQTLKDSGRQADQAEFVRNRQLLAKAAPRSVPVEPWFTELPVPEPEIAIRPATPVPTGPLNIVWEGDHEEVHSLGMVNRALCRQLLMRGHKLAAIPSGHHDSPDEAAASARQLEAFFGKTPAGTADAFVRHQWPPRFTPPPMGHWILMQPWEFGSLPASWIEPIKQMVDEVWVPSQWVRRCFVESGIPEDRVQVVRLGVDPAAFNVDNPPLPLRTRKRFKFLFVGGSIHRKGIDILLDAYSRSFTSKDDVCLVIKDMGTGTFYKGMTAEQRIAELQAKPGAPEIEYLSQTLNAQELAGLYTACDCLAHPFRGEGFGLPIVEAMASGLPVIVTGYGPTLDYCSQETGYLIPAKLVRFPEKRINNEPTVDYPWLAEPDAGVLQSFLRHVVEHPEEARAKGQAARKHILANFTWTQAGAEVEARLHALRGQPIRRAAPASHDSQTTIHGSRPARPFLSACLIVKNEEANLADCLRCVVNVADELIVVDTGSQDRTKEISREFGARVFDFPWVDSFSAARNECLRHAKGEWIFWLDADDRLDAQNQERLRDLADQLRTNPSGANSAANPQQSPFDAFVMTCRCLSGRDDGTITEVQHLRLFRNHPQIRWEHRIHEQILPAVRRMGGVPRFTDVVVEHVGYVDPDLRIRKRERDLRLLQLEYAEQPNHPFTLFNLGMTYLDLQRASEALPLLQQSLDQSAPADSIVRKLYYMIVQCYRQMGQKEYALAACRKGREVYPQDAELLGQEGLLLNEAGDLAGAEQCYLQLLSDREAPHFASVPVGLNGYLSHHNLAVVYLKQNRPADAETQWRAAIQENPAFDSAWLGLEDLLVTQGRWDELESYAAQMEQQSALRGQAQIARIRGQIARREFAAAKQVLNDLIREHPRSVRLRVLLSHALLQEDLDLLAAEQALRNILELDPGNQEARQNLAVLNQDAGRGVPQEDRSAGLPATEGHNPPLNGSSRNCSMSKGSTFEVLIHGHRIELHNPAVDRVLSGHLASGAPYEPFQTQLALNDLREGDVVLDLGANIGYYSLLLARQVGPTGTVFALEPDPDNFALLTRNVERNGYRNVILLQKAATEFSGKTRLYLAGDNSGDHRVYKCDGGRPSLEVETARVDDLLSDPGLQLALVKMDIQGAEGLALAGMTGVLARSARVKLVCEFWPWGLRRAGTDPAAFLRSLRDLSFGMSVIDEARGQLLRADETSLLAQVPEREDVFVNLFCERSHPLS
jgi:FkbM family methyltransferase